MTEDGAPEQVSRPINLLLVDDDDIDAMNLQRALDRGKIATMLYRAVDGVEALAMLRDGRVPRERRLVLLDINMPRMNGIELLRELRGDPQLQLTPVVALTTSNDDRDRIEAYRLNVAGYLLKPVTFTAFVEMMTALSQYWNLVEMP
jgi:CheY-like chemotaxis protein